MGTIEEETSELDSSDREDLNADELLGEWLNQLQTLSAVSSRSDHKRLPYLSMFGAIFVTLGSQSMSVSSCRCATPPAITTEKTDGLRGPLGAFFVLIFISPVSCRQLLPTPFLRTVGNRQQQCWGVKCSVPSVFVDIFFVDFEKFPLTFLKTKLLGTLVFFLYFMSNTTGSRDSSSSAVVACLY